MSKIWKIISSALSLAGIDIRKFLQLRFLLRYFWQYRLFIHNGGKITQIQPILSDATEPAGVASGQYFHQDILVASYVNIANPKRHIDIGSRIDGFVAHVASFRHIEVIDIRVLKSTTDNISFIQCDLMNDLSPEFLEQTDSISCLHAIEHFGLGRYGDPIDPTGHIKGYNNILRMLKADGTLYISFPIGPKDVVHFNAQRIFHPLSIFSWADTDNEVELVRFDYVDQAGDLRKNANPQDKNLCIDLSGCGIYTLRKKSRAESFKINK